MTNARRFKWLGETARQSLNSHERYELSLPPPPSHPHSHDHYHHRKHYVMTLNIPFPSLSVFVHTCIIVKTPLPDDSSQEAYIIGAPTPIHTIHSELVTLQNARTI